MSMLKIGKFDGYIPVPLSSPALSPLRWWRLQIPPMAISRWLIEHEDGGNSVHEQAEFVGIPCISQLYLLCFD
jgi:hypothetical protein